tara:strand:+ start:30 stop:365 length:336 start_codon:yes stop_codon:yes gene_type:complete
MYHYIVQFMNKINQNEELEILRKINNNKINSQREIAKISGLSLGKLNYCLRALKQKGLIKYQNFKNNKNKKGYIYILTPKGIAHKTKLTINFMKRTMEEYEELKREIDKNK